MAVKTEGKTNKKERKLPLFDIALWTVIVLAVLGGVYVMTHRSQAAATELVYTIRIEDVDNKYSGTFVSGGTLYSESGVAMGKIEEVGVSRATERRFDGNAVTEEGEYRYIETRSSEKSDVLLTVRVTAEMQNSCYFVGGNRIASGMRVETMVAGYFGEGVILTVEPVATASDGASSEP